MRNFVLAFFVCCLASAVASAQTIPRQDAIWARTTTSPITIDGVLSEPAWAVAESVQITYGQLGPMPGSGYWLEAGRAPSDPTSATIKFLVWGDSLYVAIIVKDSSVGGGLFNRFDGILSNVRAKQYMGAHPNANPWNSEFTGSFEYFYGWVTEPWADPGTGAVGASPGYFGFASGHRDSVQTGAWYSGMKKRLIWDAATTVQGVANNDRTSGGAPAYDQGYIMELKYNVALRGYNVRNPAGEIVMYSVSIYDADWQWPMDSVKFSGTRTWLQGPWGNAAQLGHMRILVNPNVTTSTTTLPTLGPDIRIPNGQNFAHPTIDGALIEQVWQYTPRFQIRYGDDAIRNGYPNTGKFRSGQWQIPIGGSKAPVLEPSLATVRYFYKGDTLYLGFDVEDQVVNYRPEIDRRDGFLVTINDRSRTRGTAPNQRGGQFTWQIRFFVDSTDHGGTRGWAGYAADTQALIDSGAVRVALRLKPNTTVDTLALDPSQADQGYTAELAINLRKLGYPAGRGDGVVFPGIIYYDGDSFVPASSSYATRTWWFREAQDQDGPAWALMDPAYNVTTSIEDVAGVVPEQFSLVGNYPNPFNPTTTVQFTMPEAGSVTLFVFDVLGRKVATVDGGLQPAGVRELEFDAARLSSGIYFYYVQMVGKNTQVVQRSSVHKMVLLK